MPLPRSTPLPFSAYLWFLRKVALEPGQKFGLTTKITQTFWTFQDRRRKWWARNSSVWPKQGKSSLRVELFSSRRRMRNISCSKKLSPHARYVLSLPQPRIAARLCHFHYVEFLYRHQTPP